MLKFFTAFHTNIEDFFLTKIANTDFFYDDDLCLSIMPTCVMSLTSPQLASVLGVMWACSVLCFLYSTTVGFPHFAMAMPLGMVVFLIIALINPFKFFYYRARMWLLRILVSLHVCCISSSFFSLYSFYIFVFIIEQSLIYIFFW